MYFWLFLVEILLTGALWSFSRTGAGSIEAGYHCSTITKCMDTCSGISSRTFFTACKSCRQII